MSYKVDSSAAASPHASRREFLKWGGALAATPALAGVAVPQVHVADDNTIRLALIGCGGRGGGAAENALSATGGPVKLHAMADLFDDRMRFSRQALQRKFGEQVDVPDDRAFTGFEAYRQAIDCLRPGDVAMLTAYAYCRPLHLEYAVEKGVNVFMEKSFAPDPPGLRRMLQAGEAAEKKNLKIATGLMCRHSVARQALIEKIRAGELGEILLIRTPRMGGGGSLPKRKPDQNELEWQIRHKGDFFWLTSGHFIEYLIHQIDECCWIKDACPVEAHGLGGRAPNNLSCGQNLDTYSVEYTFADGCKALVSDRSISHCFNDFATYVHGTLRAAQFSGNVHAATVQTFHDQRIARNNIDWRADKEPCSPWQAEWNVLLRAIRGDQPHNETRRSMESNFAAIMGRAAVHSGKIVTWDEVTQSDFQFCATADAVRLNQPAPLQADADGRYPVPVPGVWTET